MFLRDSQKSLNLIITKDIIEMVAGVLIFIFILIPDWKEVILKLANNLTFTNSILLIFVGLILCLIICTAVLIHEKVFTLKLLVIKSVILLLLASIAAILYVNAICWAIDGYMEENFWHYVVVYYMLGIIGGGACDLLDPSSLKSKKS